MGASHCETFLRHHRRQSLHSSKIRQFLTFRIRHHSRKHSPRTRVINHLPQASRIKWLLFRQISKTCLQRGSDSIAPGYQYSLPPHKSIFLTPTVPVLSCCCYQYAIILMQASLLSFRAAMAFTNLSYACSFGWKSSQRRIRLPRSKARSHWQ